jgi:hypothetical protein
VRYFGPAFLRKLLDDDMAERNCGRAYFFAWSSNFASRLTKAINSRARSGSS